MKWVSHREHKAAILALQSRIDALEAQAVLHQDALDAIEFIDIKTFEVLKETPHKLKYSTQGNVIIADFRQRND